MENGRAAAPKPPPWFLLPPASLGEMAAIAINGFLSQLAGAPWLMAPLGASCILAFGAPDSSLARPRSIIGGHLLPCLVGLLALRQPEQTLCWRWPTIRSWSSCCRRFWPVRWRSWPWLG
nr:HPP family protein [Chromobacterium sp. ASV5]